MSDVHELADTLLEEETLRRVPRGGKHVVIDHAAFESIKRACADRLSDAILMVSISREAIAHAIVETAYDRFVDNVVARSNLHRPPEVIRLITRITNKEFECVELRVNVNERTCTARRREGPMLLRRLRSVVVITIRNLIPSKFRLNAGKWLVHLDNVTDKRVWLAYRRSGWMRRNEQAFT